jgi:hypothetical protein
MKTDGDREMQEERLGRIWVFDEDSLTEALSAYEEEALAAYPAQAERIRVAIAAIEDFLYSEHADRLIMKVSGA